MSISVYAQGPDFAGPFRISGPGKIIFLLRIKSRLGHVMDVDVSMYDTESEKVLRLYFTLELVLVLDKLCINAASLEVYGPG